MDKSDVAESGPDKTTDATEPPAKGSTQDDPEYQSKQ